MEPPTAAGLAASPVRNLAGLGGSETARGRRKPGRDRCWLTLSAPKGHRPQIQGVLAYFSGVIFGLDPNHCRGLHQALHVEVVETIREPGLELFQLRATAGR